jgi:hypothetical protein
MFSRKNEKLKKLEAQYGITDGTMHSVEERIINILTAMVGTAEPKTV